GPRLLELFNTGPLAGKQLRTRYEDVVTYLSGKSLLSTNFARLSDIAFGTSANPTQDYLTTYDYNGDTDRMTSVVGPGLPSSAVYTYRTDSPLLAKTEFKQGSTVLASITRSYETGRNVLTSVENRFDPSGANRLISSYAYVSDPLGLRTSVVRQG